MVAARARIAAAICCRGPAINIRKYSAAGWPWLVDEAETNGVEVTHD
jgi:hypothetical protein